MDNLKKNIIFCPTCPKHEVLLAICDFRHLSHPLRNIKCDSLIFLIPKTNTPITIINSQNAKIKNQKSVPSSSLLKRRRLQFVTQSSESTGSGELGEPSELGESSESNNAHPSFLFPLSSFLFPLPSLLSPLSLKTRFCAIK